MLTFHCRIVGKLATLFAYGSISLLFVRQLLTDRRPERVTCVHYCKNLKNTQSEERRKKEFSFSAFLWFEIFTYDTRHYLNVCVYVSVSESKIENKRSADFSLEHKVLFRCRFHLDSVSNSLCLFFLCISLSVLVWLQPWRSQLHLALCLLPQLCQLNSRQESARKFPCPLVTSRAVAALPRPPPLQPSQHQPVLLKRFIATRNLNQTILQGSRASLPPFTPTWARSITWK